METPLAETPPRVACQPTEEGLFLHGDHFLLVHCCELMLLAVGFPSASIQLFPAAKGCFQLVSCNLAAARSKLLLPKLVQKNQRAARLQSSLYFNTPQ